MQFYVTIAMETEINPEAKQGREYPVFCVQLPMFHRKYSQEAYHSFPFK